MFARATIYVVGISERIIDAPVDWPDAPTLALLASSGDVVILADRVETLDGALRASFRDDAQALRVMAKEQGLTPVMALPEGGVPAIYREHSAGLVLSALLSIPSGIAAQLAINYIQRFIDRSRADEDDDDRLPEVRYREVFIQGDCVKAREITGPADQIKQLLRERSIEPAHEPGPSHDDEPPR